MSMTRKIISAVLCGAFTLTLMLALDRTQAHAGLPVVSGPVSSTPTTCGMFTYPCPPPNPFPIPTRPLPAQVRHWYPVQTHFYVSGSWLHLYVSHAQSVTMSGFALQGTGTFVGIFCSKVPVLVGKAFCGTAVAAYFYQLKAAFTSAAAHGSCVRVWTMWPISPYASDSTTPCQRILR